MGKKRMHFVCHFTCILRFGCNEYSLFVCISNYFRDLCHSGSIMCGSRTFLSKMSTFMLSFFPSFLAWGFGRFGFLGIVIFILHLSWLKPT